MIPQHVACTNCGAPTQPAGDGRTFACAYCGTRIQVAVDAHQLAAGLRLDFSNVDVFLQQLATSLAQAFGDAARIGYHEGRVVSLELRLEHDLFVAKREPHGLLTQHKKLVRGVALKTATVPTDRWVQQLAHALAAQANTNANAARVLAQLRGG